jgi:hypothetical protein
VQNTQSLNDDNFSLGVGAIRARTVFFCAVGAALSQIRCSSVTNPRRQTDSVAMKSFIACMMNDGLWWEGDECGGGEGKSDTGIKPTNRQRNTTLRFWDHDAAEWL